MSTPGWKIPDREVWGPGSEAVLEHFVRPVEQWAVVLNLYRGLLSYVRANVEGWQDNVGPYQIMTADKAAVILTRNVGNRPFDQRRAGRYCDLQCRGGWEFTGEPLLIARDGTLMDGQNRLTGLVWAQRAFDGVWTEIAARGVSAERPVLEIPVLVIRGLDPKVMPIIDTGKVRSATDAFAILKEERSRILAAVLRKLLTLSRGASLRTVMSKGGVDEADNQSLVRTLQEHPDIRDSVAFVARTVERLEGPVSAYALLHYQLVKKYTRTEVDTFFRGVFRAEGLTAGTAPYRMHDIIRAHAERRTIQDDTVMTALLLRAFHAYRLGRPASYVVYRPTVDQYPEI